MVRKKKVSTTASTTTKKIVKKKVEATTSLSAHYRDSVVLALVKQFSYRSVMQAPRLLKITVNMGLGDAAKDKKLIEQGMADMMIITGQKGVVTKVRRAVSNFKIREGFPIGCKVTLRREAMYRFFDRLISIAIPRIRDFRGFSRRSFDGRGNYTFGIKEQIIFPEIDYDKIDKVRGMDICITTSAKTDDEGVALLSAFNFPLRNN